MIDVWGRGMNRTAETLMIAMSLLATPANAKLGFYPHLNLRYNQGQTASTQLVDGVMVNRYQGDFISKYERRWQTDNISVWAQNTNRQPKCIMVSFTAFGLDSSWGSGAIFHLKPRQSLPNFAGITSRAEKFGMRDFRIFVWDPIAKNQCGNVPPPVRGG